MRWILILTTLCLAGALFAQDADSLDFPQPQFVNPIFDSFTRNYISTSAMGRGHTGIAIPGGVDNVLLNPAGYIPDKASLHLEMLIKPPVDVEFYEDIMAGTSITPEDRLVSPVPFGMLAGGGTLWRDITFAGIYSLPKTLTLDDFAVEINMGDNWVSRTPVFNLHQFTGNLAWHGERLHAGLNLHGQLYYLSDVTFLRTFEKIQDTKAILRPQLGFMYTGEKINAGLSFTPEQSAKWDLKYAVYDTKLPMNIVAGAAYKKGDARFTAEVDFEQCSAISEDYSDRFTVRLGAETRVRKFTYRAGYIYHPEVWNGYYRLPDAASDTTSIWWDIPQGGKVGENTQHIVSVGTSWHHKEGSINLAFLMDVAGKAPVAQINLSLDLYFSAFKRKDFLYFE